MPAVSSFQVSEGVGSTFATQWAQFTDSVLAEFSRAGAMLNVSAFQISDIQLRMPTIIRLAQHLNQPNLLQLNCF